MLLNGENNEYAIEIYFIVSRTKASYRLIRRINYYGILQTSETKNCLKRISIIFCLVSLQRAKIFRRMLS